MIQFDDRGLLAAIVQDAESGRVLMHAYMNEEALKRTLEGPDAWFYSRSRQELWHKGDTSGNFLKVTEVQHDCDSDTDAFAEFHELLVQPFRPISPLTHYLFHLSLLPPPLPLQLSPHRLDLQPAKDAARSTVLEKFSAVEKLICFTI